MSDDPRTYAGWVSAFQCSTDFEADMVRDRLDEAGIAAVVLTQRDHSFNLNVGDLSPVHVMVPPDAAEAARALLAEAAIPDADLEAAAMAADVMAPDAHDPEREAMLDSGLDSLSLSVPDDADAADDAAPADPAGDVPGPLVGHHTFATPAGEGDRGTMGDDAVGYDAEDGSPAGSPITGVHAAPPAGTSDGADGDADSDAADDAAAAYDPTRPEA